MEDNLKRLSRFRRHRAVAPILLVLALLSIGTTFSVAGAATNGPITAAERSALIQEGSRSSLRVVLLVTDLTQKAPLSRHR